MLHFETIFSVLWFSPAKQTRGTYPLRGSLIHQQTECPCWSTRQTQPPWLHLDHQQRFPTLLTPPKRHTPIREGRVPPISDHYKPLASTGHSLPRNSKFTCLEVACRTADSDRRLLHRARPGEEGQSLHDKGLRDEHEAVPSWPFRGRQVPHVPRQD